MAEQPETKSGFPTLATSLFLSLGWETSKAKSKTSSKNRRRRFAPRSSQKEKGPNLSIRAFSSFLLSDQPIARRQDVHHGDAAGAGYCFAVGEVRLRRRRPEPALPEPVRLPPG
jgi:hypothetical protein